MSTPVLERIHFETHRAAEDFGAEELGRQTGQPTKRFAVVILKELLDSALDAARSIGHPQYIEIDCQVDASQMTLSINDHGSSVSPELVSRVLDFNTRASDMLAYRAPTRGVQGNALNFIIGIAYLHGGELVSESVRRRRHDVDHASGKSNNVEGTT